MVGLTRSADFPVHAALQGTLQGDSDAFVTTLTPSGSFVYSTYLGGDVDEQTNQAGENQAYGVALDAQGDADVAGDTGSTDFPTAQAVQGANAGGDSGFVTALAADGHSLLWGTYLGGSDEDWVNGIALDPAGNAYVTGVTSSSDFPTTAGAAQGSAGGGTCDGSPCTDAFVAKLGVPAATRTITYSYDGLDRLIDAAENPGYHYSYGYDLADNRTDAAVNGLPTQHLAYDAANQVVGWTYDAVGNLLADGSGNAYGYDALDRLTASSSGSGALQRQEGYGYDGDGALVTQTVGTTTTAYAQDLASDASQVLVAQTQGVSATDYLYGQDRLAAQASGSGSHTWYLTDLQGSVRYTAYDDGTPTAQVSMYDPFGNQEDGVTPPRFGYDGELQDAATGLVDLRARWYQPQTGQFLQRDPLEDQTAQPYAYASDDPVNNSDPSGACYLVDSHGQRVGGALPDVDPDDQNCSLATEGDTIISLLSPQPAPVFYPSEADTNCLYAQIIRYVRGGGTLLRKGFYVSPAKRFPTVVPFFVAVGNDLERFATGVVEIGAHAAEVGEEIEAGVGGGAGALDVLSAPQVLLAAGLAGAAYLVTTPPQTAGLPADVELADAARLRRPRRGNERPILVVLESRFPHIAPNDYDAIVNKGKPNVLHYLYSNDEQKEVYRRRAGCYRGRFRGGYNGNRALNGCDEYPYASTYEGGYSGTAVTAAVPPAENTDQGFRHLKNFYRGEGIIDTGLTPCGAGEFGVWVIRSSGKPSPYPPFPPRVFGCKFVVTQNSF